MAEKSKKDIALNSNVGDQVIARVEQLNHVGFIMPKDYNFVNAIKASMLVLKDLKDKDKRPALEVCSQNSIATALFQMATSGLDASKKTCYFLVRGNQLCMHESYFGKVLQVKRIYPDFDPHPVVIHEGDEFVFGIDKETGCRKIVNHEQKLENLDKDFVGAYMYLPTKDGGKDLYMMTKKMIVTAWSKSSSSSQSVHKQFTEKMICKTIINSGCNMIINSTPELSFASENEENEEGNHQDKEQKQISDFQEAEVIEEINEEKVETVVDTETGEIKQVENNPEEEF